MEERAEEGVTDAGLMMFRGTTIRMRGERGAEQMCLTDMWRANGADSSKAPAEWSRSTQATSLRDFLADSSNMGKSHDWISAERGPSGGTWAHWQLAFRRSSTGRNARKRGGVVQDAHLASRNCVTAPQFLGRYCDGMAQTSKSLAFAFAPPRGVWTQSANYSNCRKKTQSPVDWATIATIRDRMTAGSSMADPRGNVPPLAEPRSEPGAKRPGPTATGGATPCRAVATSLVSTLWGRPRAFRPRPALRCVRIPRRVLGPFAGQQ